MDSGSRSQVAFKNLAQLNEREAKEQIESLRKEIEYHNYHYYVKNSPKISDEAFDRLFHRLEELERRFPQFDSAASPTQRVGAKPVSRLKKVKHAVLMLSLNAVSSEKEVEDFIESVRRNGGEKEEEFVLEPKFDGFSVELVYRKGDLEYGATRGDGESGEDISANLRMVRQVPLKLQGEAPEFLAVRGEIYMSRTGFQELNKQRIKNNEEAFANPRNAAAGMMRQLDPNRIKGGPLGAIFYDILRIEGGPRLDSDWDALRQMPKWGLRTDEHNKKVTSIDRIIRYHHRFQEQREELDYEIDGIVIKVNRFSLRERLGTRQRSPRWALAWKFSPKKEITRLREIVVSVGRTGILTPVAMLEPVNVGGVTVSRATLHNIDEVRRKDVRPGDIVRIERAGDVIPEVVKRIDEPAKKRQSEFRMPKECPSCGSRVYREGAYWFCPAGLSCFAQLTGHLIHFASRSAMNISGLGEKIVKQLVRREMVRNLAQLYRLPVEEIKQLEGFSDRSAEKLYASIQQARRARLDRFIYGLGIQHVGEHTALVLTREYGDIERLRRAKATDLRKLPDIGPEIAESVEHFFQEGKNSRVLDELRDLISLEKVVVRGDRKLRGKTFVFTGELRNYSRKEAQDIVETLGGRAVANVSRQTDFVVAGTAPGSKLEQAKKHGVKIVNENDFDFMLKFGLEKEER